MSGRRRFTWPIVRRWEHDFFEGRIILRLREASKVGCFFEDWTPAVDPIFEKQSYLRAPAVMRIDKAHATVRTRATFENEPSLALLSHSAQAYRHGWLSGVLVAH